MSVGGQRRSGAASIQLDSPDALWVADMTYVTDLFAAVSAERFLENFLALVEQALGDSIRPISDYSIVAPTQVALIRDSWNATQLDLLPSFRARPPSDRRSICTTGLR